MFVIYADYCGWHQASSRTFTPSVTVTDICVTKQGNTFCIAEVLGFPDGSGGRPGNTYTTVQKAVKSFSRPSSTKRRELIRLRVILSKGDYRTMGLYSGRYTTMQGLFIVYFTYTVLTKRTHGPAHFLRARSARHLQWMDDKRVRSAHPTCVTRVCHMLQAEQHPAHFPRRSCTRDARFICATFK
jgi:hypothetical protein